MRFWTLLLLVLTGCSSYTPPPPPMTTPVSGKVFLPSGSPMTAGRIVFTPKDKSLSQAFGEIGSDGSYKLTSFNKDDGAMPGGYVVSVEKAKVNIPKKYQSESSSDIVVLVADGQSDYSIRLK